MMSEKTKRWRQSNGLEGMALDLWMSGVLVLGLAAGIPAAEEQASLPRVESMPDLPSPLLIRDWKEVGRDYVVFVLDETKTGKHLPLVEYDAFPHGMFVLPSYVALGERKTEAINAMALAASGTLLGFDMMDYNGRDLVKAAADYFYCETDGLYGNDAGGCGTTEFWYRMLPNLLLYQIYDLHSDNKVLRARALRIADRLYEASIAMGGRLDPMTVPDYEHWSFDFEGMEPRDDRSWREPGAAGAFAWMGYMAYTLSGDEKHLATAGWAMRYLSERPVEKNPVYEVMLRYAPVTAARMNAELGRDYDLHKMMLWCTGVSETRPGWGMISGARWGGYDCDGLVGSTTDTDGYAFAMNTFQSVAAMVPVARYDQRYARTIGKWMLNLINASRLFYADALPETLQDNKAWCEAHDPDSCLAYEGLRHHSLDDSRKQPYATGDAMRNGRPSNIGLYGSSHIGYMAAVAGKTNVEGVLQLDCLAADFYGGNAYPTYLYFNPHGREVSVEIETGDGTVDIYDTVSQDFLKRGVRDRTAFQIGAGMARVIVLTPSGGSVTYEEGKMLVGGVVVDFRAAAPSSVEGQ